MPNAGVPATDRGGAAECVIDHTRVSAFCDFSSRLCHVYGRDR